MRPKAQDPSEPNRLPKDGAAPRGDAGARASLRSDATAPKDARPEAPPRTRPLGAFGERVSSFGLGAGPMARLGDHGEWDRMIRLALDLGVTLVDAAPREARPHSEVQLGYGLEGVRDNFFVSTRCTPLDGTPFDTSEKGIRTQLEDSLRRLRTDRIDLYQVHDVEAVDPRRVLEEALPTLVAARERGEVRYIGASGRSLDLLEEIVTVFPVDAVLSYACFDLGNADLGDSLLPAAEERGIAVISASPLHMGLLANPAHGRELADNDRRKGDSIDEAFRVAKRVGTSLPRLALGFAASDTRIASTLVGCANEKELRENVAAFYHEPSEVETRAMEEIRAAFRDQDY